jgi:hypothetical protein
VPLQLQIRRPAVTRDENSFKEIKQELLKKKKGGK